LPDEVLHIILLKLDFSHKIHAGKVCTKWDQLLKDGTASTRHWVVDYNVDTTLAKPEYTATEDGLIPAQSVTDIVRYVTVVNSSPREVFSNGTQLALQGYM
jgi:hypothetical protein